MNFNLLMGIGSFALFVLYCIIKESLPTKRNKRKQDLRAREEIYKKYHIDIDHATGDELTWILKDMINEDKKGKR